MSKKTHWIATTTDCSCTIPEATKALAMTRVGASKARRHSTLDGVYVVDTDGLCPTFLIFRSDNAAATQWMKQTLRERR